MKSSVRKSSRAWSNKSYIEFISQIRSRRKHLDMTQAALAAKLGRHQSYISKIETCERRLDVIEALELCKVLNIHLIDVVPQEYRRVICLDDR